MTGFNYGGAKPASATTVAAAPQQPAVEPNEYKPTSRWSAPPAITFEKVVKDESTKYNVGAIWTWTYKHLLEHEAFAHALKHLKGEGEDPLHWKRLP